MFCGIRGSDRMWLGFRGREREAELSVVNGTGSFILKDQEVPKPERSL